MTVVADVHSDADVQSVATGRPARRGRWGWVAIVAVLLVVGAAGAWLAAASSWTQRGMLDPESPGPTGTRAVAQVLAERGIDVDVVHSPDDAAAALGPDATLVLGSTVLLSDDTMQDLVGRAGDVVVLDPAARDVRLLFDGAEAGGYGTGDTVDPRCDQADARRAGAIAPGAVFTAGDDAATVGCYPVDDAFGMLVADRSPTSRAVAIDGTVLFTNDSVTAAGNAALAFGLLGRHPQVVWLVPSLADADAGGSSLGALTPPWVTPAIALLVCAALVAAIWRGRRFGPLVAENLPVTVRAAETMEGRARLYARSRDTAHVLDALRLGALDRIARMLGLGPAASASQIADAAADRLGAPRDVVRGILIDSVPQTEADLVRGSDRLRDLEAAVRASVQLERTDR